MDRIEAVALLGIRILFVVISVLLLVLACGVLLTEDFTSFKHVNIDTTNWLLIVAGF